MLFYFHSAEILIEISVLIPFLGSEDMKTDISTENLKLNFATITKLSPTFGAR